MKLTKKTICYLLISVVVALLLCKCLFPIIEGQKDSKDPSKKDKKGKLVSIDDKNGICYGALSSNDNHACGKEQNQKNCELNTNCMWQKGHDIQNMTGGLEGFTFIEWMRTIGLMDVNGRLYSNLDPPIPTEALTHGTIDKPLLELRMRKVPIKKTKIDSETNNFLYHLKKDGNDKEGIVTADDVDKNPYVPKNLRSIVKEYVKQCESGWDSSPESKRIYEFNGSRPIMAYSLVDGLVCRNPYFKPRQLTGSIPRIYSGEDGCPSSKDSKGKDRHYVSKGGDSCDRFRSECNWENRGIILSTSDFLYNNLPFTNSGQCSLPACRAMNPNMCLKRTAGDSLSDLNDWVSNKFNEIYR